MRRDHLGSRRHGHFDDPAGLARSAVQRMAARRAEDCGGGQAGTSAQNRAATQAAGAPAGAQQTVPAPARPAANQLPAGRELKMVGVADIGELLIPDLVDGYIAGMGLRPRGWSQGATPEQRFQEGRDGRGQTATPPDGGAQRARRRLRRPRGATRRHRDVHPRAERAGSVAGPTGARRRPRHAAERACPCPRRARRHRASGQSGAAAQARPDPRHLRRRDNQLERRRRPEPPDPRPGARSHGGLDRAVHRRGDARTADRRERRARDLERPDRQHRGGGAGRHRLGRHVLSSGAPAPSTSSRPAASSSRRAPSR